MHVALRIALTLLIWDATSALGGRARAGNDELPLDMEAALAATAVTASVTDAGAMYYNPAGLAFGEKSRVDATGTLLLARFHHVPKLVDAGRAGAVADSSSEWLSLPTVIGYVFPWTSRVRVGVGLFGQNVSNTRFTGQLDHAEGGAITHWNVASWTEDFRMSGGPAIAYRVSPHVALGATLLVVYASRYRSLQLGGGRNLSTPRASASDVSDGFFSFSANGYASRWALQAVAGVRYDAPHGPRLGLSVLTPALSIYGSQDSAVLGQQAPNPADAATVLYRATRESHAGFEAELALPAKLRAGFAWPWSSGYVEADLEYIMPLRTHGDTTPDWKNLVNVMVGSKVFVREALALGAGFFTDRSPYRAPYGDGAQIGADYYGGTFGVQRIKRRLLAVSENARELVFISSLSLRYAFARAQTRGLRVPASYVPPAPGEEDTFGQTLASATHQELSLNIGATVGF